MDLESSIFVTAVNLENKIRCAMACCIFCCRGSLFLYRFFFFFLTESFFFAALSTWTKFLHFVPSDGIVCFHVFTGPDGCVDHLLLISLFFFCNFSTIFLKFYSQ